MPSSSWPIIECDERSSGGGCVRRRTLRVALGAFALMSVAFADANGEADAISTRPHAEPVTLPFERLAQRASGRTGRAVEASGERSHAYPIKPIRMLFGSTAGSGAGDQSARLLAQKMADILGQNVIVDNR